MDSEQKLIELLSLLESSYTCKDNSKLNEITKLIKAYATNYETYIELLFQGLSLTMINNKEISLNLHISISTNLKNIIMEKRAEISEEKLLVIIRKIFQLFFATNFNPNLLNESIISIFENIIKIISSLESLKSHIEEIFKILLQTITQAQTCPQPQLFINISKIVVKFSRGIFEAKNMDQNNIIKIINDYYLLIIETVFKNVPKFIDPNKNLYNEEYFNLLNNLIEDMYYNFKTVAKMDNIDSVKFNELIINIFQKYYPLIYELVKIQIPYDKESEEIFNTQNSIIVFNLNEKNCTSINNMKSKCFQFFSFITEQLSLKNKKGINETYLVIKNEKLIEINAEIIKLIISSFQDILNNKEKFDIVKRPKEGVLNPGNCYNNLLFNMILLILRCFAREPIKSEFASHMKYFVLNILFPLVTSTEKEKLFLENDYDTYHMYINDLINDFKFRNFRTALCYLIKKICEYYFDMNGFILSYIVEMLNYIFNMESNNNINSNNNICNTYNIYLNRENKSLINNFNDEIKIDFCFLMLLLLKDNVIKNNLIKNKFFFFIIKNQDKIHMINSDLICIKVCKIYNDYSSYIFNYLQLENDFSIKKKFVEKLINQLLGLLIPNKNNIKDAIVSISSDTIMNLLKYLNNSNTKTLYIKEILNEGLQFCFKHLVKLIDICDNTSLNIIVSGIIEQIRIKERQDVINAIDNFTKKFKIIVNTNYVDEEDELKNKASFINQYFIIINNYLKGANKFDIKNENEIMQINNILTPVIDYMSDPNKYPFCEEIVCFGEYYMKALNSINEISVKIFDNLFQVIYKEKLLTGYYYSFISTFLLNINKTTNHKLYIDKVISIIKLSFSFPKENYYENILSVLLLNMQILSFEGQIDYDTIKYLILENLKCYFTLVLNPDEQDYQDIFVLNERSLIEKIEQVIVTNFSLFSIYFPDTLYKILMGNLGEIFTEYCQFKNLSELIIKLYASKFDLVYSYYPILGKCDILCLCSLFMNMNILNTVFDNQEKKLELLKLLINLVVKHKEETIKTQSKWTKDDLDCAFVNDDEEKSDNEYDFEDEDSEYVFDDNFHDNVKNCFKNHNIINNNDEFKIFSDTFYQIKNNDETLFNKLVEKFNKKEKKILNDLLFVRNVKVEYKGKKFDVPRRTLKIKRNVQ